MKINADEARICVIALESWVYTLTSYDKDIVPHINSLVNKLSGVQDGRRGSRKTNNDWYELKKRILKRGFNRKTGKPGNEGLQNAKTK